MCASVFLSDICTVTEMAVRQGWGGGGLKEDGMNRVKRKYEGRKKKGLGAPAVANMAAIAICSSMILVIHTQHNHGTNIVSSLSYVVPWRRVPVRYFILRECYFTLNVI
jgi:hypothetical protein